MNQELFLPWGWEFPKQCSAVWKPPWDTWSSVARSKLFNARVNSFMLLVFCRAGTPAELGRLSMMLGVDPGASSGPCIDSSLWVSPVSWPFYTQKMLLNVICWLKIIGTKYLLEPVTVMPRLLHTHLFSHLHSKGVSISIIQTIIISQT